jgi:hypothetical protein
MKVFHQRPEHTADRRNQKSKLRMNGTLPPCRLYAQDLILSRMIEAEDFAEPRKTERRIVVTDALLQLPPRFQLRAPVFHPFCYFTFRVLRCSAPWPPLGRKGSHRGVWCLSHALQIFFFAFPLPFLSNPKTSSHEGWASVCSAFKT